MDWPNLWEWIYSSTFERGFAAGNIQKGNISLRGSVRIDGTKPYRLLTNGGDMYLGHVGIR